MMIIMMMLAALLPLLKDVVEGCLLHSQYQLKKSHVDGGGTTAQEWRGRKGR